MTNAVFGEADGARAGGAHATTYVGGEGEAVSLGGAENGETGEHCQPKDGAGWKATIKDRNMVAARVGQARTGRKLCMVVGAAMAARTGGFKIRQGQ